MRDPAYSDRVREDFDRLALLSEESGWEPNSHYHPFLLRQLPERLDEALGGDGLGVVGAGESSASWPHSTATGHYGSGAIDNPEPSII
jgi:hypothetical protein